MKIRGNTVGTTTPRPDFNQNNPRKADFIKNKPVGRILPEVTSGDNGKVLKVLGGKWSLGDDIGLKLVDNGDGDFFAVITQSDSIEATDVDMTDDGDGNFTIVGTQKNDGYVATLPQLYAPSISISGTTLTIKDNSKNSPFTTGYNVYVDGVKRASGQSINILNYVSPGKTATITATVIGEGFGITFKESEPSNAITFTNAISFTVNGISYFAGIGQTFGEWIDSELSADGFSVNGDGYVTLNGEPIHADGADSYTLATETIDGEYTAEPIPQGNTFTLKNFYHTSPNGDNTFNFDNGMTWAQWKQSEYNSFEYVYGSTHHFETMSNSYCDIDVACQPDTPVEGICYADGTPVKDNEVITATTYYYCDLDSYEPSSSGDCEAYVYSNDEHGMITIRFTEGMTWAEWCDSADGQSHNAYEGGLKFDIGGVTHELTSVGSDEAIENGGTYYADPY